MFHGKRIKVKIWFAPELAPYIMEKVWHESQVIHRQDDGSIIFEAEVAGTRDMKFWVMSWGSKAVVLKPESLRDKILAEAEAMAGRYGDVDRLPLTGDR